MNVWQRPRNFFSLHRHSASSEACWCVLLYLVIFLQIWYFILSFTFFSIHTCQIILSPLILLWLHFWAVFSFTNLCLNFGFSRNCAYYIFKYSIDSLKIRAKNRFFFHSISIQVQIILFSYTFHRKFIYFSFIYHLLHYPTKSPYF